jgi:phosphatidylglycerophosphate synthase
MTRHMSNLTVANQLTLLRMLLIPAFVLLVIYAHLGWALAVLFVAGTRISAGRWPCCSWPV